MPVKLLIDENVDNRITKKLETIGVEVLRVAELSKGIPDIKVLELSREMNAILITEDRDFGEWVFAHNEKDVSVIYLRYYFREVFQIAESLTAIIKAKGPELFEKFVVITPNKIRIREIF